MIGILKSINSNKFDTAISIKSYTSSSNKYTFPANGYVHCQGNGANSVIVMCLTSSNGIQINHSAVGWATGHPHIFTYVVKGMKCYFIASNGVGEANFYKLI